MKSLSIFTTIIYLSFPACLIFSCKPSSPADTTTENATESTYKNATLIEPEEFEKGMKRNKAFLLDVRQPQEFEQGHIEGAVNINFFDPTFKSQLLGLDKGKHYYMYCKNDTRSQRAAEFMLQNDYQNVFVLNGGYEAWKAAGK